MFSSLKLIIGLAVIVGATGFAHVATKGGWGLPGLLDQPVSVRQDSTARPSGGRYIGIVYFGSRRHRGGSYGYGK